MLIMCSFYLATYYQPPNNIYGTPPCILPNATLTIGYGTSGAPPQEYALPEGCGVEAGYLKLFFSTSYVDWSEVNLGDASHSEDEESFLDERLLVEVETNVRSRGTRAAHDSKGADVPPWGCIKYTVISK